MERLLLWRVWDRMLEIEFVDRSVALAGKAFVSFFPLVIVVAAFVPQRIRSAILTTITARLGIRGDALTIAMDAFASSEEIRQATGVLGLVFTIFFATSFTTALQRMYLRAWRRPPHTGAGAYWRGATWLLLLDEVRPRVLLTTGVITSIATVAYAVSATVWMPGVVTSNEAQFGFFGVALSLVTWFSGVAICILIGACAGPVLAEDPGWVGKLVRGGGSQTLTAGARPSLPPPDRELGLRDAFHSAEDG